MFTNAFPAIQDESNVPTPEQYRKAVATIKAYRKKVKTNYASEVTQRIADFAKIKDEGTIKGIEGILADHV